LCKAIRTRRGKPSWGSPRGEEEVAQQRKEKMRGLKKFSGVSNRLFRKEPVALWGTGINLGN